MCWACLTARERVFFLVRVRQFPLLTGMGGWGGAPAIPGGGEVFRAGGNRNLQILARQNLCHFLKMSEQITYGSQ